MVCLWECCFRLISKFGSVLRHYNCSKLSAVHVTELFQAFQQPRPVLLEVVSDIYSIFLISLLFLILFLFRFLILVHEGGERLVVLFMRISLSVANVSTVNELPVLKLSGLSPSHPFSLPSTSSCTDV